MVNPRLAWFPKLLAGCGIVLAAPGAAVPAYAQLASGADVVVSEQSAVPEVIVTAQRTSTLESKTPVAMSVLSGAQLIEAGLTQPSNLADRLPDVRLDGAADGLKITIRGVSNADTTGKGDPSAAFMLDGIYIARPQFQNLSFYDLDRIEVLRGPQGTLYGRNTTAGVVNVISNAPTQRLEGAVSTDWGNYASRQDSAMLNIPVNDVLALRAALAYNAHNSYLNNGQGTPYRLGLDRNDSSGRLSARLALSNTVSLLLRIDHSSVRDNNDDIVPDTNFFHGVASGSPLWYGAPTSARLTNGFVPPNTRPEQGYSHKDSAGLSADFSWNLGAVTVSYLGAHRHSEQDFLENYYYRIAPAYAIGVHESFGGNYGQNSHELRIASNGSGPLTAQGGVYYFREESNEDYTFRDLGPLGLPPYYVFPTGPTIAQSKAAFGQATVSLSDRLRLTAGARYTRDAKSRIGSTNFQQASVFNPATDLQLLNAAEITTHKSTWRLGAEFDLAPATLLYGTVSTGYKSGGFNDGCLAGTRALGINCPAALAVPAATLYYQPETLTSYEAGLKTSFWEKRASLNATAFDYDYRNLQLSGVAVVHGAPRYVTGNAGVASVKGLELEGLVYPTLDDKFNYSLTLLDAHYVSYSPDGVHSWDGYQLDRAPSNVLSLGYEHRFRLGGGDLKGGVVSRKSSSYAIGVPSQLLQYRIPSRTQTDATLNYHRDGAAWRLQASVKNLDNKVVPINIDSFGMVVPSDPRTVDVRFTYQF